MKSIPIENVSIRKEGHETTRCELVVSVSVDGQDYVIFREPMPTDGELSHCVHALGIEGIVAGDRTAHGE